MRIIKGLNNARPLLTRESSFVSGLSVAGGKKTPRDNLMPEHEVQQIIADVHKRGDEALFSYTKRFDGVDLKSLEVSEAEILAAYKKVDTKLVEALKLAASRIRQFHSDYKKDIVFSFMKHGLGRETYPLNIVGVYVPGGTAAYPSTVLMTAIPAQVAGVKEIIMLSPPSKEGIVPAATLVAADLAKVNRVFKIGGAQAIAAMAFGTESVPKVDKICGPGNIFVVTAKKMVYGIVDIESLAGPSEIVIIADDTANAAFCAADLIAQAEHDAAASAILITTSVKLANDVDNEVKLQLAKLERKKVAIEAMDFAGAIVLVDTHDEAIELANTYAPEHLSLMVKDAKPYVQQIRNAGCIFIGGNCPVALGDYVAGPSHVLPTGGSARFASPLRVEDFLKITNVVALDNAESTKISQAAITIAEAEGLTGHAQAIRLRLRKDNSSKDEQS